MSIPIQFMHRWFFFPHKTKGHECDPNHPRVCRRTNPVWSACCYAASRESSNNSSRSPLKTAMVIQDESLPAAPPPQIRILKRPASNGSAGSPLNQNRPTPQVKSLAQREAEYAEARKRILGSACPEETPQEKTSTDRWGPMNVRTTLKANGGKYLEHRNINRFTCLCASGCWVCVFLSRISRCDKCVCWWKSSVVNVLLRYGGRLSH